MLYIGLFIVKFPINTSDKVTANGSGSAGKCKDCVILSEISTSDLMTELLERESEVFSDLFD